MPKGSRVSLNAWFREKKREVIIFLSQVALFFLILAGIWNLPVGSAHNPGPGFLPFWSDILFLLLSLINFFLQLKKGSEVGSEQRIRPGITPVLVLMGILGYILVTPYLGFLLTIFLLLLLFFSLTERKNFPLLLVTSGVTTVLTYLVFVVFLKCQFPKGLLGIG
jgi:hypothetical protein